MQPKVGTRARPAMAAHSSKGEFSSLTPAVIKQWIGKEAR